MRELHLPWLELSIVTPLIGAIVVTLISNVRHSHWFASICGSVTLAFAAGEYIDFSTLGTFEAHDHWDLLTWFFHADVFVIDEFSAPLLPLAALLVLMTIISTVSTKAARLPFAATLLSESILLATLSCRSPWILIALLILGTVPVWWEIRQRGRCTRVFTLHMGVMAGLFLAGQAFIDASVVGTPKALLGGALITTAALIRSGIVPVHCWMTDLFEKATFATSLLFVTPLLGAYAVMRLVLPIAPDWALQSIAVVSLITAIYASGMALIQKEARRFFCYLFLSHASLVLVGLELVTPIGLAGALCVWYSVGIALAGFGLTLRCVEARIGPVSLRTFHGLYEATPTLAVLFLLTGLGSIGFPGTIGFIGAELLIEGAVGVYPLVGFAVVLAATINSIAVLQAYFRIFTGVDHRLDDQVAIVGMHARPGERLSVIILTLLVLGGGLLPQHWVASRYHAAKELIRLRSADQLDAGLTFSNETDLSLEPSGSDT